MSSTDLHQVVFKWPRTEPTTVIVTGTFDKWASSIHLVKVPSGFEAVIQIPWEQKIKYKFIVDGEWLLHEDQPTEVDPGGFVNNVYTAPARPLIIPTFQTTSLPVDAKPTAAIANNHRLNGDSVVAEVVEKPEYAPQTLPKHTQSFTGTDASTVTARDDVSSALSYVASGLGAPMHNAIGIDPTNIPKTVTPTPKSNDDSNLPPDLSPTIVEESAPNSPPSPVAPVLPMMIVPVNATGNNTVGSSPLPESMRVLPHFAAEPSMLKTTPLVPKAVVPIFDITPLEALEEKANGQGPDPPVVNTPCIQSVVEESTERMNESSLTPKINTLPTSEAVTQGSASEHIPITKSVDATYLNNDLAVLSETATIPSTANANVEAEPTFTSSASLAVTRVPGVVVEESTADFEPIVATVISPTNPNLVTEEKAQTTSSVPEIKDGAKSSTVAPESHAAVVTERKVAEPIATPTVPTTPRKKTPTTSSLKDIQDFPTNSSLDNSPSPSRFNSVRKKRTSFFGKIKNIFHHEKEKQ